MKLYSGVGDAGETAIIGGTKISKDDLRMDAIGTIDELNSLLGLVISSSDDSGIVVPLTKIQKTLFVIGTELATEKPAPSKINSPLIGEIESLIDSFSVELASLVHFILPGGCQTASLLHHARTVCRRAERRLVSFSKKRQITPEILKYLNRLGDLLFVMARYVNRKKRIKETVWPSS